MGENMNLKRSCAYYYKTCALEKMTPLDKKRYEYFNNFGYNIESSSKRNIDEDFQIKRHKNSESK